MRIDYVSFLWTASRDAIFGSVGTYSRFFAYSSNDSDVGKHGVFPTRKLVFPSGILPRESSALFIAALRPGLRTKITSFVKLKGLLPTKIVSAALHCDVLIMLRAGLYFQILDPLSRTDNENLIASRRNLFNMHIDLMSISSLTGIVLLIFCFFVFFLIVE